MERITSIKNPLLQHIRKLQTSRAYREASGEFVADGWKLLDEALRWYPQLTTVLTAQSAQCPRLSETVRHVELPDSLMDRLSTMQTPQGVIFTGRLPERTAPEIGPGTLLLDRIQDPGNLGTILRTANAFSVPVVLTNDCADPFSEKTLRASMGAVFRKPPGCAAWEEIRAACEEKRMQIAAAALSAQAEDIRGIDLNKYLVVIGSEGQGIRPEILQEAEKHVIIPMAPQCESLNAAVAGAIVMWQMNR